jgi:metal-responsive CopG/Arc/MetJ family transcriptional regulator
MKKIGVEKRKYTTITIPTKLFEKLQDRIKNTGFSSVSDYATYILRETFADISVSRQKGTKEAGTVISKLRALGYLE